MQRRIYFGCLFNIKDGMESFPKIYHIHKITQDNPRWEVGIIKSSFDIDKRVSLNPHKNIREKVFEKLRKLEFSDYPSRDQCLFATMKGEIKVWKELLLDESKYYQILEIELLKGKIIRLDESFFDYDNKKFEYMVSIR